VYDLRAFATYGRGTVMRRALIWAVSACWSGLAVAGCAKPIVARYIYQDGEFGVVGIPINTYQKKIDFRGQADALMARHFPEGYEIVRAEEVNEGERILDLGRKTEIGTEPGFAALHQVFKLGKLDRTTSYEQKDKLQVRECRIIYKRKPPCTPGRTGQFASATTLAPPLYIDPNAILRHQIKTNAELLAKADTSSKKPGDVHVKNDADVKNASGDPGALNLTPLVPTQFDWNFEKLMLGP
jgi:hypothetical protein